MPRLRIASLRILLDGPERPPLGWGSLEPFLDHAAGPVDFLLRWRLTGRPPNPAFRGEAAVEDLQDGSVAFHRRDFDGWVDPAAGFGALETSPSAGSLRSALRFVVSLGLLERGGFLLHSAGLLRGGDAFVLCGPSGAGKSTAAALSRPGAAVLSDELCGLCRTPAGWRVFGTPFSGSLEIGSPQEGSLACVAFLEQSALVEARPLSPSETVRRLYAQVFRPGLRTDRHARWLALASFASSEARCFLLRFRQDPSFWGILQADGRAA